MDGGSHSLAQEAQREPPHSIEAEQALLGGLLANNDLWDKVAGWLRAEHFANAAHAFLYDLIGQTVEGGGTASPVTLKPYVEGDDVGAGILRDAGGWRYMVRLVAATATVVNFTDYARQVKDAWVRRKSLDVAEALAREAATPSYGDGGLDVVSRAQEALDALGEDGEDRKGPRRMHDVSLGVLARAQAAARGEVAVAIDTGLADLDRQLGGGLRPGDLVVVAGRPSMGKTKLIENVAATVARRFVPAPLPEGARGAADRRAGGRVVVFSLEMDAELLAANLVTREAEVPGVGPRELLDGHMVAPDGRRVAIPGWAFGKLTEAAMETQAWPLHVVDDVFDLPSMGAELRKVARRDGVDLVIIDYLQLMTMPEGHDALSARIGQVTRGIKRLAKRLGVPVVLLSQLSREVEKRDNKRPQLSDLRESGAIEQDADVVIMLYREQYYLERTEPARKADEGEDRFMERYRLWEERCEKAHNIAEAIVAKQRLGPVGTVRLWFDGARGRFGDLARQEERQGEDL